ncbi:hypothetical protein [Lysobacter antibioticus]|uniref:Dolichyl-phosphate-mannose-mannosyltransferase family protein n=1 Tax=Lysobacter antibioticus TaxID=84531 RepID=A0A0S2F6P8_LYSAN|nr:hypothetical protein [Lysobacter antibioticus]ALN79237.1 dolichyl-phosphate-mannose-mannosyltransferase family protein [Lysobacter antibioticus]
MKHKFNGMLEAVRRIDYRDFAVLFVVAALSFLVLIKNLWVDNSVVFQDEYVYKVSADRALVPQMVVDRELAPPIPNHLYLSLYGQGSRAGSNYYVFAQALNIAFWAAALLFLYRIAILSGLSKTRSLVFVGAAGLLPLSAYTKYFMPEMMFFSMFCLTVWGLLSSIRRNSNVTMLLTGVVAGSMYFVKPHALVLIGAFSWFLMFVPGRIRWNLLFGAGALAAIAVFKTIYPAPSSDDSAGLGVYAQILDGLAAKLSGYRPSGVATDLMFAAQGTALFMLGVFALAFVVAIAALLRPARLLEKEGSVPEGLRLVSICLITVSIALIGMAVVFTVLIGELGRVHSRYYFFIYPLCLLLMLHAPGLRFSRAGKIFGAVVVLSGAALFLMSAAGYSPQMEIAHVSDSPEWGFVFWSDPWFIVSMGVLAVAACAALFGRYGFAPVALSMGFVGVLSTISVADEQKGIFRNAFTTGREAVAVEALVGTQNLHNAVVVGEDRGQTSKFLFFITGAPNVENLPKGRDLAGVIAKYPTASHYILISDAYVLPQGIECPVSVPPQVRICRRI